MAVFVPLARIYLLPTVACCSSSEAIDRWSICVTSLTGALPVSAVVPVRQRISYSLSHQRTLGKSSVNGSSCIGAYFIRRCAHACTFVRRQRVVRMTPSAFKDLLSSFQASVVLPILEDPTGGTIDRQLGRLLDRRSSSGANHPHRSSVNTFAYSDLKIWVRNEMGVNLKFVSSDLPAGYVILNILTLLPSLKACWFDIRHVLKLAIRNDYGATRNRSNSQLGKALFRKLHLFTIIQLIQLLVLCAFGFAPNPYVEMVFPVLLVGQIVFRYVIGPHLVPVNSYVYTTESARGIPTTGCTISTFPRFSNYFWIGVGAPAVSQPTLYLRVARQ
ncbi:solute carrier family 4 (sodium borate transporter) member 11 [Clonorchis sinensis]|uniref:Solute carrier family 4 (Sodium borate transporter) member 11 n=1 Tax=Clonorchis sinensis TaxID=79923 RepID=G7YWH3_CLOSI|nr:solute carrier family 4 (sodium borate transporter) member 11 [Clonorchis sinensis]